MIHGGVASLKNANKLSGQKMPLRFFGVTNPTRPCSGRCLQTFTCYHVSHQIG